MGHYPILPEGEWDFEIVGFCLPYYYPILPEGEWDLEIVGFCLPYYYPIPSEKRGWDLVVPWFHLHYYSSSSSSSSSCRS